MTDIEKLTLTNGDGQAIEVRECETCRALVIAELFHYYAHLDWHRDLIADLRELADG